MNGLDRRIERLENKFGVKPEPRLLVMTNVALVGEDAYFVGYLKQHIWKFSHSKSHTRSLLRYPAVSLRR